MPRYFGATGGVGVNLLSRAVACFLAKVAGPAGTRPVYDDLQWAGPDALMIHQLVRLGPAPPPLVAS